MKRRPRSLPPTALRAAFAIALPALLAAATPNAAPAQEIVGTAVDAAGRPLPQVPVALHRVGEGNGATVATGSTDAQGRFSFPLEAVDSAVYFVAMRYKEAMYIGPPVRAGTERVGDYVVRADAGSEVGAVMSALTGGGAGPIGAPPSAGPSSPAGAAGAIALVALLGLTVALLFVATAPGYRRRQRRTLLIELAGVEDRLEAGSGDAGHASDEDRRRRAALLGRLAPRG